MRPRDEAIHSWLAGREQEMAALLERLVRAESPTEDARPQSAALAILVPELVEAGYLPRMVSLGGERRHLYARPRGAPRRGPRQLLVGHIDTVWPAGSVDELEARVEDGHLHGPGAYDMKGGLVQLVFALQALSATGTAPEVTPLVFVNSDEETGSVESAPFLKAIARETCRALVLEAPAGPNGELKTGRKGVGQFQLTVHGRSAHAGASPEEGVSAILELSHQIQRLFAMNDAERGITVNVGTVDGGLLPNVIAPKASARIDVRVATTRDARDIEQAIRNLPPVNRFVALTVEGGFERPPMPATERNRNLYRRAAKLGHELGLELGEATLAGGASDANFTSPLTATLDGLGPCGGGAHAAHEHVVLSSLPERAALLALLLLEPA